MAGVLSKADVREELLQGLVSKEGRPLNIMIRSDDGWVNLTELCKSAGKEWYAYKRNDRNIEVINYLKENEMKGELPYEENRNVANAQRGSWGHPYLAISVAQWCSPTFAVAVSSVIYKHMHASDTGSLAC